MSKIIVIGMDGGQLTPWQRTLIDDCGQVVAGRRHKKLLVGLSCQIIPLIPVDKMLPAVAHAQQQGDVAILASGDPLFFGIGRRLLAYFDASLLQFHPAISSIQQACTRFKIPWDDMHFFSLHGRPGAQRINRILNHEKTMVFTDHHHSPDQLCRHLRHRIEQVNDQQRLKTIRVRVAENMGLANERIVEGDLETISQQSFDSLNLMLIEQPETACPLAGIRFGLQEADLQFSRGLITKAEVRAITLHLLALPQTGVFWDVGGGSGSISIEAGRLNPELDIYCIEHQAEQQANILANIRQHGRNNITPIDGLAPAALTSLPDPDRVFIGGSGGHLADIIETGAQRLPIGGRIVINAVLPKTATAAPILLNRFGLMVESRVIAVTRQIGFEAKQHALNPITIITGIKSA